MNKLLIALVTVISLVGCGKKEEDNDHHNSVCTCQYRDCNGEYRDCYCVTGKIILANSLIDKTANPLSGFFMLFFMPWQIYQLKALAGLV